MSPTYPPEPWALKARMDLSTFLVPPADLPELVLPAGHRPVTVAGRVPVGAAWVTYEPGGVLDYRELLVTALLRRGAALRPHVFAIWVDSAASCAGGRELWGIPKGMAAFGDDPATPACTPDGATRPVAAARIRSGRALPVRVPVTFSVVQCLPLPAGPPVVSPVRSHARILTASARWECDPEGVLGFLDGRRPVTSVALREVDMRFGATPAERSRA